MSSEMYIIFPLKFWVISLSIYSSFLYLRSDGQRLEWNQPPLK